MTADLNIIDYRQIVDDICGYAIYDENFKCWAIYYEMIYDEVWRHAKFESGINNVDLWRVAGEMTAMVIEIVTTGKSESGRGYIVNDNFILEYYKDLV